MIKNFSLENKYSLLYLNILAFLIIDILKKKKIIFFLGFFFLFFLVFNTNSTCSHWVQCSYHAHLKIVYLALFIQFILNCNGMRNQICWFEMSEWRELLSISLAGNMGFKDLIIAYLYSGGGTSAVYKSLLGFSFHCLPRSNGNTLSNFSVIYTMYLINKLKP